MKNCFLENCSPEKLGTGVRILRNITDRIATLTSSQVNQLRIRESDIMFRNQLITKIILCGIIIEYREALSPQKKPILMIKLKDSTGICSLQLFQFSSLLQTINQFKLSRTYVKVYAEAKCQGTFRFETKVTIKSMKQISDMNELNIQMMETMKFSMKGMN